MLREAVCTAPHTIEWRDYDIPKLAPRDVRIEAQFGAAKHGTELSRFKGGTAFRGKMDPNLSVFDHNKDSVSEPMRIGNMVVGRIIELGAEVRKFSIDDRVLAYGGIKRVHTVPETRVWLLPKEVPWQSGVCLDPANFSLGAIRDGHIRIGDAVAFFGLGAISLMGLQIARLAGAHPIVAVDPLENRRKVAENLGATHVLDPTRIDAGKEIKKICAKRGADVVIEYSGKHSALQDALRGVAFGGTVVCGASPTPYEAGLDFGAEAHINRPNIIFSRACSDPSRDHPRWSEIRILETSHRFIVSGCITGVGIVSDPVPVENIMEGYLRMAENPEFSIKLGYSFGP
ncbi:MAG: putative zinc-type alcohol dehydrogenase-like protein YdjJ [Candidatus Moanabacter tarae]|uniref:Putative zinc-type alcohol dehydrogenase-like protein YdjJ n=1 Tax=Candidatus Moanibacter tarae TaxID=2200854 RepID=A0A2Z4ADH3_9BACT|nr:MAG: putative zinc-type alcohol dehydrogenase-like protein YdjJ [Candidatus Moanabacter tarae]|tara:strand:+ start:9634 stop:10665 length:1032 start_codon:yes stop_codon:yes gene_type:complete